MRRKYFANEALGGMCPIALTMGTLWVLGILIPAQAFAADPLPLLGVKACGTFYKNSSVGPTRSSVKPRHSSVKPMGSCGTDKLCEVFCPRGKFKWKKWAAMYAFPANKRKFKKAFGTFYPDVFPEEPFKRRPVPICGDPDDRPLIRRSQLDTPSSWTCEDSDGDDLRYSRPIHCTDGTRPVYYFRPADDPASTKVMIRIGNGGSACAGDNSCRRSYTNSGDRYSSAVETPSPSSKDWSSGLFGDSSVRQDYHIAIIEQCAGGRAIGQTQHFDRISRFHHGRWITEAVLLDVDNFLTMQGGEPFKPTQVVFVTHSATSFGTYMSIDGLNSFVDGLAGTDVDVRLNAHSGLESSPELEYALAPAFPPCLFVSPGETALYCGHPNYLGNRGTVFAPNSLTKNDACPTSRAEAKCNNRSELSSGGLGGAGGNDFDTDTYATGTEWKNNVEWATELDKSCLDSPFHGVEACSDPLHVLMFHVETPVFISAQKYDANLRSGSLNLHTEGRDAWENEDFSLRVRMAADSLRRTTVYGHKDTVGLPGHGVFLTHCGGENSHKNQSFTGKWLSQIWDNNSGDYRSQGEYFSVWLNSRTAYQPYCASNFSADTCGKSKGMADAFATNPGACFLP